MELSEYIKENNNILLNPGYSKQRVFFHDFQRRMEEKYDIKTIEIYSTAIFPRQKVLLNERYYLSDNHFWNMYEHYLIANFFLTSKLRKNLNYYNIRRKIESFILLILANLQDHHPYLALSFAQEYQMHGMEMGDYERSFFQTGEIPEIDLIVLFSYIVVFSHEIAHKRFATESFDKNRFESFMDMLSDMICNNSNLKGEYVTIMGAVAYLLEKGEKKCLEELYCDFSSMMTVADLIITKCKGYFDIKFCAKTTVGAITMPSAFRILLLQNQMHWDKEYYIFKGMRNQANIVQEKIEKTYKETIARTSFIEMNLIEYLIEKYGISEEDIQFFRVQEFDEISKALLMPARRHVILDRAKTNEKLYSMHEARDLRNRILKWTQDE